MRRCILVGGHYYSKNGRNNVLRDLPDWAKENYKSKITKHLLSPICFCQRETLFTILQI